MAIPQVNYQPTIQKTLICDFKTSNKSFLDVHYFLKNYGKDPIRIQNDPEYAKQPGIINNAFFLILNDPDLIGVDPRDPLLTPIYKKKILRECIYNYWYFLREVVLIPEAGGAANGGKKYGLHRGNLALNYCLQFNLNIFAEFPRQQGKTTAVLCRILWEFLFGTSNSPMIFINKKHEDSKMNLQSLRDIRAALPTYLQMSDVYGKDGKKIKVKNSVETLENPNNNNRIKTLPAARNAVNANSLGRGMTIPRIWYDEYAFIPYNDIVYKAATPAFNTASENARRNRKPYGIIITTTPGDLTTDMGIEANNKRMKATPFSERWYDFSPAKLQTLLNQNTKSSFVYIRFTYQQLGRGPDWFKDICIKMELDWTAIRREVCLEWAKVATDCPFSPEELEVVKNYCKDPIKKMPMLNGMYEFDIFDRIDYSKSAPIAGVDVSGGIKHDFSTITIIDSTTTKVCACFNCNYVSTIDLGRILIELVQKYIPNLVINIERNGGFGLSVIAKLLETPGMKKNIFYEIKDNVIEERIEHGRIIKKKQLSKVYGTNNTGDTRLQLMDLLRQRMDLHKDKFISKIIHSELETLELKKNGRVEHASNAHDDQIFSYLMALHVWYNAPVDVLREFHIRKSSIKTDKDLEDCVQSLEEEYKDWNQELIEINKTDPDDPAQVEEQLKWLNSVKAIQMSDWVKQQHAEDDKAIEDLAKTRYGRKVLQDTLNIDPDTINGGEVDLLADINAFYN